MTDYHNVTLLPPQTYDMCMTGTGSNSQYDVTTSQALPNGAPYSRSDWISLPLYDIFNRAQNSDHMPNDLNPAISTIYEAMDLLSQAAGRTERQSGAENLKSPSAAYEETALSMEGLIAESRIQDAALATSAAPPYFRG